jgi:hypothetical protein
MEGFDGEDVIYHPHEAGKQPQQITSVRSPPFGKRKRQDCQPPLTISKSR